MNYTPEDLRGIAERLEEEPVEYYREAAAGLRAFARRLELDIAIAEAHERYYMSEVQ